MNRRDFLRSTIAGLLGCALPAGLLAGPRAAEIVRAGRELYAVGIDHGALTPYGYAAATILMRSGDNGRTWEIVRPEAATVQEPT